ncbi:MAG TPA: hemerythrin domain-containing protein [Pseudonocardia sp.]|jgi:hypothetical protein|nr:hemerythrin domain-containing protein [Pseudonocardia sp.]
MPDVITLILTDHETFRRRFAELEKLRDDPTAAGVLWAELSAHLEVHASAEEEHFYPAMLERIDDAEDETKDAIGDHDDIREGIRRAAAAEVGSDEWWAAVQEAREANDHHLEEEEQDDLAPFLQNVPADVRQQIGERFRAFQREHAHGAGLSYEDKDPDEYVEQHTG